MQHCGLVHPHAPAVAGKTMNFPHPASSRRNLLTAGFAGLLSSVAGTLTPRPAAAASACGGLTREQFNEYIGLFNANDPRFINYYHDDVVLELSGTEIKTPQGIRNFYAEVKAHIHEKVTVAHFISDATGIAVELPSEFKVYKDWENGFFKRPLKAGEVLRIVSFVLYRVEAGKFRHIRSSRYKLVNDWRLESP
jgi:hypothetical protein